MEVFLVDGTGSAFSKGRLIADKNAKGVFARVNGKDFRIDEQNGLSTLREVAYSDCTSEDLLYHLEAFMSAKTRKEVLKWLEERSD